MHKSEFDFSLSDKIIYHSGSSAECTCDTLSLRAPSNKDRKRIFKVQQMFLQATKSMISMSKDQGNIPDPSDANADLDAGMIVSVIMMSGVDFGDFTDAVCNLLYKNCYLDDDTKLNEALFDKISLDDAQRLVGEYVANFLLPSWMQQTKKQ
jgi:hypothetical protein